MDAKTSIFMYLRGSQDWIGQAITMRLDLGGFVICSPPTFKNVDSIVLLDPRLNTESTFQVMSMDLEAKAIGRNVNPSNHQSIPSDLVRF